MLRRHFCAAVEDKLLTPRSLDYILWLPPRSPYAWSALHTHSMSSVIAVIPCWSGRGFRALLGLILWTKPDSTFRCRLETQLRIWPPVDLSQNILVCLTLWAFPAFQPTRWNVNPVFMIQCPLTSERQDFIRTKANFWKVWRVMFGVTRVDRLLSSRKGSGVHTVTFRIACTCITLYV